MLTDRFWLVAVVAPAELLRMDPISVAMGIGSQRNAKMIMK